MLAEPPTDQACCTSKCRAPTVGWDVVFVGFVAAVGSVIGSSVRPCPERVAPLVTPPPPSACPATPRTTWARLRQRRRLVAKRSAQSIQRRDTGKGPYCHFVASEAPTFRLSDMATGGRWLVPPRHAPNHDIIRDAKGCRPVLLGTDGVVHGRTPAVWSRLEPTATATFLNRVTGWIDRYSG